MTPGADAAVSGVFGAEAEADAVPGRASLAAGVSLEEGAAVAGADPDAADDAFGAAVGGDSA